MERKRNIGPVTAHAALGYSVAQAIGLIIVWILTLCGVPADQISESIIVVVGFLGTLIGGWAAPPTGWDSLEEEE